jgi:hypothetical protein
MGHQCSDYDQISVPSTRWRFSGSWLKPDCAVGSHRLLESEHEVEQARRS